MLSNPPISRSRKWNRLSRTANCLYLSLRRELLRAIPACKVGYSFNSYIYLPLSYLSLTLSIYYDIVMYCRIELRMAYSLHKQIVIVRDYQYKIPDLFPSYSADIQHIVADPQRQFIYMAEYYEACLKKLVQVLGPPDR